MKPGEVRILADEQLDDRLEELREEWRQLRFDQAVGRLQQTKRIWQIRRDIARIKTIQREREIEQEIAEALGEQ